MESGAFMLILSSAFLNALWNLSAKKLSGNIGGIWLALCIAGAVFAPHALTLAIREGISTPGLYYTAITALLNAIYFLLLCKSYEWGEVSVVYPISRGTGVLGTVLAGAFLLHETITPLGALGIVCVGLGTLAVSLTGWRGGGSRRALLLAVGNGASIAACAIFAKQAVGVMDPAIYNWGLYAGSAVLLAPYMLAKHQPDILRSWRDCKRECLLIGIGSPLSYVFALYAFRMGKISYLGPIRECSIVIGAVFGSLVFGEKLTWPRATGILAITAGVILIRMA